MNVMQDYNYFQDDLIFIEPVLIKEPMPPVYNDDPVNTIEPVGIYPGTKSDPIEAMPPVKVEKGITTYSGVVLDYDSGEPIPYASVYLFANGTQIAAQAADNKGNFYLTETPGDMIAVTAVGYASAEMRSEIYANGSYNIVELKKDTKTIDPVVLPPGTTKKNNNWLWWLLGVVVIAKIKS